jgi:hypothetical protein
MLCTSPSRKHEIALFLRLSMRERACEHGHASFKNRLCEGVASLNSTQIRSFPSAATAKALCASVPAHGQDNGSHDKGHERDEQACARGGASTSISRGSIRRGSIRRGTARRTARRTASSFLYLLRAYSAVNKTVRTGSQGHRTVRRCQSRRAKLGITIRRRDLGGSSTRGLAHRVLAVSGGVLDRGPAARGSRVVCRTRPVRLDSGPLCDPASGLQFSACQGNARSGARVQSIVMECWAHRIRLSRRR